MGILTVILITGCIGENYDFSPPTVILVNPDNISQRVELSEANIKWYYDEQYDKVTKDIQKLAKKQTPMYFNPGQNVDYTIEDGYFEPDRISVSVLKAGSESELKLEDVQSFTLPDEKGEYTIVFDIKTGKGNAQYVGSIVIE